ncbi:OsmC family protein [Roseateles cavernae]|uniref:OsmC family protein n=1 Tax=Roseateles cavernae TaxID=3153578 RepID=UPI0032E41DA9
MAEFSASVTWARRADEVFTDQRYSRRHAWGFDGGAQVPASSSPHSVPLPYSDPAAVDPEEAFVASLSSCHMLWFLSLAAKAGWVVESYRDDALGVMARNARGKLAMTRVTLRPVVQFAGAAPDAAAHEALHHTAHEACYIASSVACEVLCEPQLSRAAAAPAAGVPSAAA